MNLIKGTRLLAACALVAGLGACGDDGNKTGTGDATDTGGDTTVGDTTTTDTAPADTTPTDTTPADTTPADTTPADTTPTDTTPGETEVVTPTCDMTDGLTGDGYFDYSPDTGYVAFGISGEAGDIILEFYDLGEGSPLTGPGEYPLADNEADQNYATCTTCALILTEEKTFLAIEGTIRIEEIDEEGRSVKATLEGAKFIEVDIDSGGENPTFESTPVPNGEGWCITDLAIEYAPECSVDADCTEAGARFCDPDSFECVACLGPLDCSAAAPVCGLDDAGARACIAGIDVCTGDDANESDDGPLAANALTLGTPVEAKICGVDGEESGAEFDWYTFTLAAETNIEVTLGWTGADVDFDFYLVDSELATVQGGGASEENPEMVRVINLAAGTYYVAVNSYAGAPDAALDYELSVAVFTPECTEDADCLVDGKKACDLDALTCVACVDDFHCTAAAPVCQTDDAGVAMCGITDECTGDDAKEHGDDGPAGANAVTPGTPISGKICGAVGAPSAAESDYYKVSVPADGILQVSLAWALADADLDLYVLDSTGAIVDDAATSANPEEVTLSNPGAGDYYLLVYSYDGVPSDATEYTLTVNLAMP